MNCACAVNFFDEPFFLWTTNHCAAMVNTAHEAQPDLGLNSLNYLCMALAIKMVHQYFHPSDLVIKSTYLIKKY